MESLTTINPLSKNQIIDYLQTNHLAKYEADILNEMLVAIKEHDLTKLDWFSQFGDAIRVITTNVNTYRKQLEFGFTEIAFNQHGWFKGPEFLNKESLIFGNPWHHSEHSTIYLGTGANNIWTFAIDYSFGTAGGGYHLSVYGKQYKSREDALTCGLNELKDMMTDKIGNSDTSNYKQPIILATLRDISKAKINMVQLSLF